MGRQEPVNDATRDFAIREIGCIVCRLMGKGYVPCAKHHLLSTGHHGNGKRRGEKATVGLCDYHHQGSQAVGSANYRRMKPDYGPSYYDDARAFRALWPDQLLLEEQDRRITQWQSKNVGFTTSPSP